VIKCKACPPSRHNSPSSLIKQPSGYYLCPTCDESIKAKLSKSINGTKEVRQSKGILIDKEELVGLKQDGLASLRLYVYMALRIDGVTDSMQAVDIQDFCKAWAIQPEDFMSAIASLSKKGVVKINVPQFNAQAVTHKERIQAMEAAYESAPSN
jgi:hypothetical protein